jgi:hypothetical protein
VGKKFMKKHATITCLLLAGLSASTASAQIKELPFKVAEPPVQEQSAPSATIDYVTGGIGTKERDTLLASESNYNLKVEAAYNSGHYLSDVTIRILDSKGNQILSAMTDGPLFYARLAPGTYTVEANFHDTIKKQTVTLAAPSGKPKRVVLVWPEPAGEEN